jgi:exodeoxyribonuclease VII large subunit
MDVRSVSFSKNILTVSELTGEIKDLLEVKFPDLWVEGEISNLRIPPSGHIYFTLKDDFSQIRAVVFKMQARLLRFLPEDGLQVICQGRLGLYEKRGEYQLILNDMEPKGIGALQLAFLQLKERLEKEGLFEVARKRPIPMVPQKIGIVTSPTGAVIRDMLHIIGRRYENVHILLYPVRVQGEEAPTEIAKAIKYFNESTDVDVLIVARGGGSLEDLWAFNEERVAWAIYRSNIPVVSAVGHETDYTISDFVADLRAPTPSAAAELVVREKREIQKTIDHLKGRLEDHILGSLEDGRRDLAHFRKRLSDPRRRIEECFLRVDDLAGRLRLLTSWSFERKRGKWLHVNEGLDLRMPLQRIGNFKGSISLIKKGLEQNIRHLLEIEREKLGGFCGRLGSLSPLSILQRGYSITRKLPFLQILRDAAEARAGDKVEVRLHRGALICNVEKVMPH